MQGNRAEFYRQTIVKLISSLEPGDDGGRRAIYERMRSTNEGYIEKNRERLSDTQIQSMRDQLDQAIAETERSAAMADIAPQPGEPLDSVGTPARPAGLPDGVDDPLVIEKREAEAPDLVPPSEDAPPPLPHSPSPPASSAPLWRERRFAVGLAAGVIAGCVLTFAALTFWPAAGATGGRAGVAVGAEAAERGAAFEAAFQETREIAEKEIELLGRIEAAIVERQRSDGAALAKAAGQRFQKIEDILPAFPDPGKEVGDENLTVTVRATRADYKIRFATPICATIRFMRPDLLDPQRLESGISCRFFGAWNEGGAEF